MGPRGVAEDAVRERLARFLLEHDNCGDDFWNEAPERRRDFYRVLARDVLAHLGLTQGVVFAPAGFDNAVGVLLDGPAEPKFQAGKSVYLLRAASEGHHS